MTPAGASFSTILNDLRPAFAGAAATFSGIGLARFAYVPLFPAMVGAGWVTGGEAGYLGGANLAGYLAGVLLGRTVARRLGTPNALHLGMALVAISCLACAWDGGIAWLGIWRGVAGVAGGTLMALAGPAVQGAVAPGRRGLAGGIVFTGVGTGVVVAALFVPALLTAGVSATWLALAVTVGVLWGVAGRAWPASPVPALAQATPPGTLPLCLAYGVSAAGLVPHMVYFADLVVRGRGFDIRYGAMAWLLFGIGGLLGPLASGRASDRWGAATVLRGGLALQVAALALSFAPSLPALMASACLAGFAAIGLTTATLARARELAGPDAGAVWVRATSAFAIAQATVGLGLAALFAETGSHGWLFGIGLALSALALAPACLPGRAGSPATAS